MNIYSSKTVLAKHVEDKTHNSIMSIKVEREYSSGRPK
jgi:hypothetical protein